MKNLLAEAMARVISRGLTSHSTQMEELTRELEAAIQRTARKSYEPLTIETLFTTQNLNGPAFAELRKTLRNPGLKLEATISELRRSEAYFIRAHDNYVAGYSDQRAIELRWAELRLAIARLFYDDYMVRSLPPKPRAQARPKAERSTSVAEFEMGAFSADEQKALRQAISNREDAIRQLETIIRRGDATSDTTHLICSYLRDPNKIEQVNRWLTAEQSKAHHSNPEPENDVQPMAAVAEPLQMDTPPTRNGQDNEKLWPPRREAPRTDPVVAQKLVEWLRAGPNKIRKLYARSSAGDIRLNARPDAPSVAGMFETAVDHPLVQNELSAICARLEL
jgi:hypothetical protein